MPRCLTLLVVLFAIGGCAGAPPTAVVWYMVSPPVNATYPHGDLNSSVSSWERVKDFPNGEMCQNQLRDIHNQLDRPVGCIASDDPRLAQE